MSMKISVIIPVYNKEKYIKKCLESLINQTLTEIEIICINDGSTDDSLRIIEEYSKQDSRIKVFSQENKGPGHARNQGLKYSKGEYIAFIDADDWIEIDSLELLYDNAKKYDSELVFFNAIEHLPNNQLNKRTYFPEDIEGVFNYKNKKDIVMNNFLIVCTKLHKFSFLKENDIQFSDSELFEDVFFHIKSTINAEKITYVNKYFYNYRRTEKNTRQSDSIKSNKSFIFLDTINEIKLLLIEKNAYEILEDNFIKFKLTELNNLFNNVDTLYKKDFYNLIKNDFNNNPIKESSLNKLPIDKKKFYKEIIESKNYEEYAITINSGKDVKKINKIINKIKRFF